MDPRSAKVRFGSFIFDFAAGRLERDGERVRLTNQPAQLLAVLLQRSDETVTREEIQKALWGDSPYSDSERSLNVAVAKVREALGDSAEDPKFIATVPRRGYRFIAPVASVEEPAVIPEFTGMTYRTPVPSVSPPPTEPAVRQPPRRRAALIAASLLVVGLTLFWGYRRVRGIGEQPPSPGIRLAVLPFDNLIGDAEQDYVCDGLTEELITRLGQLQPERLAVIARTSVMRYKKGARPVREIGRELGVDYVLEGSVRGEGGKTRVTAQLIRVKDEIHLWAASYDRDLHNLIGMQDEVALNVASHVRLMLDEIGSARIDRPLDPRAHDEYLLGRYQWNKRTEDGYRKAVSHFERAIALDAAYARAYAGLADTHVLMYGLVEGEGEAFIRQARAAASKAIEINPQLAEAHTSLGLIAMNHDWDWAASQREYRRAIELDPNYPTAHHWYAEFLNAQGRFDEALGEIERARQLDPLSLMIGTDTGKILAYARRYPEAIAQLHKVLDEDPNFLQAKKFLLEAYIGAGKLPDALALTDEFEKQNRFLGYRVGVLERLGRYDEARETLLRDLQNLAQAGKPSCFPPSALSLSSRERTLSCWEYYVRERNPNVTALKVYPLLDFLRGEPRFQAMLRHVGLDKQY